MNCTIIDDLDSVDVVSEDSELDAEENEEKNVRQLKANMTKSASMCVFTAAKNGKVVKAVNVIGFLADCKTSTAKHVMKMQFDLISRKA